MVAVLSRELTVSQEADLKGGQSQRLKDALAAMGGDPPSAIPFLVRLLENPASPIALPGKIDLYRHDCLHLLLNRGISAYDEAFVVGFTMGNDVRTRWFHLTIFKVFALLFYPNPYRFNQDHLKTFDLGVAYGRATRVKNLNQMDFSAYEDQTIEALRRLVGIDPQALRSLRQTEVFLTDSTIPA